MIAPQLVAHRGHPARFPENSLSGLADALDAGAAWVEIDLQLSADGTPWLYHDETLQRISGRRGRLAELRDAECAELSVGEPSRLGQRFADERACSLERFVGLLADHPAARAFVEVKPDAVARFGTEHALEAVASRLAPVAERCVLISFDLDLLALARARTALPLAPILKRWKQRGAEEVGRLAPEYGFVNVDRLPGAGRIDDEPWELAVYEVVDPALALELGARGAAFVETFAIRDMQAAFAAAGADS